MKKFFAIVLLFATAVAVAQTTVTSKSISDATESIEIDAQREISLVNDATAPGNDMCYGTNGSGVKGWYSCSASGHSDGANCAAGEVPLGVDANGAVQGCYEPTEADISDLSHTTDTNLTEEEVEDFIGNSLIGTETRITVSYDDANGEYDFVVDDMNDTEVNDLGSVVTWANVPNANITAGSVTQHEAALTITESQISDLAHTTDTNTQLSQEQVEDFAGGMDLGTETRATFTYNDTSGNFDIVVDDMNDDVPESGDFGNAADLDANGQVADNSHNHTESNISDLDHAATSLTAGVLDATTEIAGALCGTNEILEDQGATWACIATPSGGGGHSDGANCAAGEIPLGVDANGAVQGCYEPSEADISDLAHTTDTNLTEEEVEDFIGNSLVGTETRITVSYDDANGEYDFVVDDMNDDVPESGDFGNATDLNTLGEVVGGDADTALALAANGANCSAGNYPLGVSAAGAVESCTADDDTPESGDFGAAADLTSTGALDTGVIDALNLIASGLCGTNQILEDQGGSWACIDTPSGGAGFDSNPCVYELSTSHNITTTESTIPFDTEVFDPDTNCTNSSGELNIVDAGYYEVSINVPINDDGTAGTTRGRVFAFLQKDAGTGTWTTVNQIRGQVYEREASGGTGLHAGGLVSLVAGEDVRVRIDVSSTVDVSTETGEASISLHRIRTN